MAEDIEAVAQVRHGSFLDKLLFLIYLQRLIGTGVPTPDSEAPNVKASVPDMSCASNKQIQM
jgi:hypothetical protein